MIGTAMNRMRHADRGRGRTASRAAAFGAVVALLVGTAVGGSVAMAQAAQLPSAPAQPGSERTSSQVTLTNAQNALNPVDSPFPDLKVTISQTKDLVSQGIRISWTGGKKSEEPSGIVGGRNFLQIAQCWGEDPDNPGYPDRRTCQYGGTGGYGAMRDGNAIPSAIAPEDEQYTAVSDNPFVPTYTGIPFVAVNDKNIVDEQEAPKSRVLNALKWDSSNSQWVKKPAKEAPDLNSNQFFTQYTTNEVKWAPSGADGTGSVPFEVQTAMQSTALGCGEPVKRGKTLTGRSCWLVIIPRGEGDSGSSQVDRSGLWWDAWQHSLAVKLDFKPVGVRCTIGAVEKEIAGSELLTNAIASWQPGLCTGAHGAAYVHRISSEADALRDAAGTSPSALAITSRPLDLTSSDFEKDPLVYAPLTVSAPAITFAIDARPDPLSSPVKFQERRSLPITDLKLTPRLVAKLLTSSYVDSLPNGADKSHIGFRGTADPGRNPRTLIQDPEFIAVNGGAQGEWAQQRILGASVADALMPDGRSDIAMQLWNYVLSDPKTVAWLNGEPDENGMIVNPYYSTNPKVNPTGAGLVLPRDNFPKADPIEKPNQTDPNDPKNYDQANGTGAVNLVTWRPYTPGFTDGAYDVLRGNGLVLGAWDPISVPPKFGKSSRELFGNQQAIALTTAPAAEQYQTVTASLLNPAGAYVQPTRASIGAAAKAMTPVDGNQDVLGFDLASDRAKQSTQAYPVAMPVYAALNPEQTDASLRATYANLIRYAVKKGQVPGTDVGELPPGYAPLPKAWVKQSLKAADLIGKPVKKQPATPENKPSTDGDGSTDTTEQPAPDSNKEPAVTAAPGGTTPPDPESTPLTVAVPAGLAAGALAAVATPFIGRFRRRV